MAMPDRIEPMAATATTALPRPDDAWAFEIKWDGIRAIAYIDHGHLRLTSRTLRDITHVYPDLAALGPAASSDGTAILDGEIIAFDAAGRPSFEQLQQRMNLTAPRDVAAARREVPVAYIVFDLLYADGRSLLREPYTSRRQSLAGVLSDGERWQVSQSQVGDGDGMLSVTRQLGLEGVVAKRLASTYQVGRRSRDWLKVKNVRRQEVVVGGWIPGEGRLNSRLGALAVGVYEDGALLFVGKVGTGFDDATRNRLLAMLRPLERTPSPFDGRQPQRTTVFVEPRLVCEVEFSQWTDSLTLRHPSFKGLRDDKDPADVVREEPVPPPGHAVE
jgi:bifunctional non-homologous end joining protein LigD